MPIKIGAIPKAKEFHKNNFAIKNKKAVNKLKIEIVKEVIVRILNGSLE
jgi:hypothetical protein